MQVFPKLEDGGQGTLLGGKMMWWPVFLTSYC